MPRHTSNTPAPEPGLLGSLDRLYRRRWLALAIFVGIVAAAAAFAAGLPPLYRASAMLLVQNPIDDAYLPEAARGTEARLQAIKQVALSRERLLLLAERFDLYPDLRRRGATDEVLARLHRDIQVDEASATTEPSGRSATVAFTVSYVGEDPETVAQVANGLSEFYVAQNDRMRVQQASRTTEVIGEQLKETRAKLNDQLSRLQGYAARTGGALPQQVDANLLAIHRIDGQLRANADERANLLERRQTIQNQLAELSSGTTSSTTDPAVRLTRLKAELAELRSRLADRHPDVRQKESEVASLEQTLAANGASPANGPEPASQRVVLQASLEETNAQLDRLAKNDAALESELARHEGRVQSAATGAPQLQAITGDLEATRELYDTLQRRQNEAQLAARVETGIGMQEFSVLDAAVVPVNPAGPNRLYLLLLGLVAGLALGFAGATLADRLDTSFHSVDELRQFTSVPVLASIPKVSTNRDRVGRLARSGTAAGLAVLAIMVVAVGAFEIGARSEDVVRLLLRFN